MRETPFAAVSNGQFEAVWENADRGTYTFTGVTVLDAAGRVAEDGKLMPNGCIVIDNAYTQLVIYMLDTGELVRLEE